MTNARKEEWDNWTKQALEWEVGEDSSSEMTFQLKLEWTWRNKQKKKDASGPETRKSLKHSRNYGQMALDKWGTDKQV